MPLKKIRRSPTSSFFIKKTICLMQNKPHFMKRGHLWGEGEKQLKRKNVAQVGIMNLFFLMESIYMFILSLT